MPIKIDFLANVRDFLRGTDDAEKALDDVADSLDDMARDAKKGGSESERSVEKLEDSFRDAARRAKDLGDAGKTAGRDVERGMDRAEEGLDEFKDEANSTAKEAAASFDGSAESIVDAFQEVAANAFAGFGPAGAVAGLAAAGGIGLLVAAFDQAEERRQALADRADELAQAYIEAGTTVLDTMALAGRIGDVLGNEDKRKEAQDLADVLGIDLPEAARILAGDTNALAAAQDVLAQKQADLLKSQQDGKLLTEEEAAAYGDKAAELQRMGDALGVYADNNDKAAEAAQAYTDALLALVDDAGSASVEVDELGNRLLTLPDETQIFIDAETGQATTDVSRFKGDYDKKVQQMNANDITMRVRAAIDRSRYDAFVRELHNTTIKIKGRVVTVPGAELD